MSRALQLFGTSAQEQFVISAYLDGAARRNTNASYNLILAAGFVNKLVIAGGIHFVLEDRHPGFAHLLGLLRELTGRGRGGAPAAHFAEPHLIRRDRQLPGLSAGMPRIVVLQDRYGAMTAEEVLAYSRDLALNVRANCIASLKKSGFIVSRRDAVSISTALPKSYLALANATRDALELTDHRYPSLDLQIVPRPRAQRQAADGAPRLFGADTALRNLMAIAKYGPLRRLEERRLTGTEHTLAEDQDNAPFGRGAVAVEFGEGQDRAAMLDPRYPGTSELRHLLLDRETFYPLLAHVPGRAPIEPLALSGPGRGDELTLFGSPVPTTILVSIGRHGWTFEALCVEVATGYYRQVLKRSMTPEGVIAGGRSQARLQRPQVDRPRELPRTRGLDGLDSHVFRGLGIRRARGRCPSSVGPSDARASAPAWAPGLPLSSRGRAPRQQ